MQQGAFIYIDMVTQKEFTLTDTQTHLIGLHLIDRSDWHMPLFLILKTTD